MLSAEETSNFNCLHCPILILPMRKSLRHAYRLFQNKPECFSAELLTISTIAQIATLTPLTAEHMIRSVGGFVNFLETISFQDFHPIEEAFWVAAGHDQFKVEEEFYRDIVSNDVNFRQTKEQFNERELFEKLFKHLAYAPAGLRVFYKDFKLEMDNRFLQSLALTSLHHISGSQNPSIHFNPNRPSVNDFIYLEEFPDDRSFIENVVKVIDSHSRLSSLPELLIQGHQRYDFISHTAKLVSLFTPFDIIDAMHRRAYWDDIPWLDLRSRVAKVLETTALPGYLVNSALNWYKGFETAEDYYLATLTTGWNKFAADVIRSHRLSHFENQTCEIAKLIQKSIPKIPKDSQVLQWLNISILPNLFMQ